MKKFSYIHSFTPYFPERVTRQSELVDWVMKAHTRSESFANNNLDQSLLKRFALNENQILERYVECPDEGINWSEHLIYRLTKEAPMGVDIGKRNEFFSERALDVFRKCYQEREFPDHVLHVTCTGYVAPSAPQRFFSGKMNAPGITHAYHMGCYASLPTVRVADTMALSRNMKVDIVHNEICSLHFNPSHHTPEQIVVQTLFGDGHIYYQVSTEPKGFKVISIKEKIIPNSLNDRSWIPGSHGMNMTLSREVPLKIRDHILPFVMEMTTEQNIDLKHIFKEGIFAIHPGGPRIIELVQRKLELEDHQVSESKKVLYERGNMSSATLPHVWNEILQNQYPRGTPIISLAFGPGLTVFGSIFEVE